MRTNLWIWAKRALCLLALAAIAILMLPACDKTPDSENASVPPYEKELTFNTKNVDSISVPVVKKYADDRACTKIYLICDGDLARGPEAIKRFRANRLQPAIEVSPKVTGKGDIYRRFFQYTTNTPGRQYMVCSAWLEYNAHTLKNAPIAKKPRIPGLFL